MTAEMLEDEREILYITVLPVNRTYCVGVGPVALGPITNIECYPETGQMTYVPWIAVYRGDALVARVSAEHCLIEYLEEQ